MKPFSCWIMWRKRTAGYEYIFICFQNIMSAIWAPFWTADMFQSPNILFLFGDTEGVLNL